MGLTVVSMGMSAPELVVSLVAAVGGKGDLAIGNVVGSNLANIGLVLGISAIVKPLNVSGRVVTREVPVMLLVTALLLPVILDLRIARLEGLAMLVVLVAYLWFVFRTAKDEDEEVLGEYAPFAKYAAGLTPWAAARDLGLITMGIAGLVLGAFAIRESVVALAEVMGISELVIGLTLVSIGTSLPELATSLVATMRKEEDIAVGNIIGSNVFNIAAILGITATVSPLPVSPEVLRLEFPAAVIMSVLLVPIVRANLTIRRAEGMILLGTYLALGAWVLL